MNAVTPIIANGTRVRIPTALLQLGMFVSDLDRPWAESPFLIEGLLVERDTELALVQSICREVTIDLGRSWPVEFVGIQRPEQDEIEAARRDREAEAERLARQGELMVQTVKTYRLPPAETKPVRMPGFFPSLMRALFDAPPATSQSPAQEAPTDATRARVPRGVSEGAITPDLAERPPSLGERLRRIVRELGARQRGPAAMESGRDPLPFQPASPEEPTAPALPADAGPHSPVHQGLSLDELDAAEAEIRSFEQELPIAREKLERADALMDRVAGLIRGGGLLNVEQISPVASAIVESITRNQNAMLWLSRLRAFDERAHARSVQCGVYMATFARHLGLGQEVCEHLTIGGMVLDVGKLRVPPYVLAKPGPLHGEEVSLARDHVMMGVAMLENSIGMHPSVIETVLRHHEREDGSGYPGRLRERDIGLYGRIAGIVDTFLALTNPRTYAPEVTMQEALRVLLAGRGTLFHAPLVEHFIQSISLFPVGSLVELSNGEIAAVVAHNRVRRLKPRVMVLVERDGTRRTRPTTLDLLYSPRDERGEEIRILRGVSPEALGIDASELFLSAGLS